MYDVTTLTTAKTTRNISCKTATTAANSFLCSCVSLKSKAWCSLKEQQVYVKQYYINLRLVLSRTTDRYDFHNLCSLLRIV